MNFEHMNYLQLNAALNEAIKDLHNVKQHLLTQMDKCEKLDRDSIAQPNTMNEELRKLYTQIQTVRNTI